MSVHSVYVLGAGASYVHNAPLTNGILPHALMRRRRDPKLTPAAEFLNDVFGFDPRSRSATLEDFPGLGDVLSMVDMALERKESLARGYDPDRLREVRTSLEYAIYRALRDALAERGENRRRSDATKRFVHELDPDRDTVISFNYDVIIDIALSQHYNRRNVAQQKDVRWFRRAQYLGIDYGLQFANLDRQEPDDRACYRLLKLHGSFNWLRSMVTGEIYFGGLQKAVGLLYQDDHAQVAQHLDRVYAQGRITDFEPVLITPTHLKDLRNYHIVHLWKQAEEVLRRAQRIVFIGYSLPADDLHVKYLFKRAMRTRLDHRLPKITVVDKTRKRSRTEVQENYERFFGKSRVRYFRKGYEDYVKNEMVTESRRSP